MKKRGLAQTEFMFKYNTFSKYNEVDAFKYFNNFNGHSCDRAFQEFVTRIQRRELKNKQNAREGDR